VIREVRNKIGILTLNNQERRNALSRELVEELLAALNDFQRDSIKVVILRGTAGAQVWSAGHDVREFPPTHRDPLGYDDPLEQLLRAVQEFPAPVIAMVHGSVWGGSCELVLTCDLAIGDDTSSFAITPAKLGLPYNASGIMHFVNRLGLNIAKEMFFTADPIPADRAEALGILNHRVPSDQLLTFTLSMAERITSRSAVAISVIKEQFRLLTATHALSPDAFERIQGLRRRIYDSADYQEGVRAFLEKRAPNFSD
jgi:methylmalonyl-CoA decarboxylase